MPIERLPPSIQPAARRARRWLMTDATAILVMGIGILLRGFSYLPIVLGDPPPAGTHPAELSLPMPVWGVIWLSVGSACIVSAFVRTWIIDALALAAGVMLYVGWGSSFLIASLIGHSSRGWVSAIGYFSVAILVLWAVWRGKRGDLPKTGEGAAHAL